MKLAEKAGEIVSDPAEWSGSEQNRLPVTILVNQTSTIIMLDKL